MEQLAPPIVQATATALISSTSGGVSSLLVTNPGSGYGGAPAVFLYRLQRTGGNVAGIVDENIDIAAGLRHMLRSAALCKVDGERVDLDRILPAQRACGFVQCFLRAGDEVKMAALGGKALRHRAAQALRAAGDQHDLVVQIEIHVSPRAGQAQSLERRRTFIIRSE